MPRRCRRTRDEGGLVLPMTVLCMVALIAMVAIVVDLGMTRAIRRDARSAADAASTAGALALGANGRTACETGIAYAFTNLGGTQPSNGQITSACAAISLTCPTAAGAETATVTVGEVTVEFTTPVPQGSSLLRAEAVGGGSAQAYSTANDGSECQRVAVRISRPQARFFGRVIDDTTRSFATKSVARYSPAVRPGPVPPALVTLNQATCKAVDVGNGNVIIKSSTAGPGVAYSDSNGTSSCSGGGVILDSSSSGRLIAEQSSTGVAGSLAWYQAAASRGWHSSSGSNIVHGGETTTSARYVGQLFALDARTTRTPADRKYRCRNVPVTATEPLCTGTDPVSDALTIAGASGSISGATMHVGACDTTTAAQTWNVNGGTYYVACPAGFTVKGNPLHIRGGGTVVLAGPLNVEANGTLAVNVSSTLPPPLDADGRPVASTSSAQTLVISRSTSASAIRISSNSAAVYASQTTFLSRGGFDLQSAQTLKWTPPTSGARQGLLYWSESTEAFSIQGSPQITANGVMFQGNGKLFSGGGGTIDLRNVQAWVDRVEISGSGTVKLSPDPANSILVAGAGSVLVR